MLTGKTPSNKTQVFILELICQKTKVVWGKTPIFVISPFCFPFSIVLTLAFVRAVLYGNVTFSVIVVPVLQLFEKGFGFSEKMFQF